MMTQEETEAHELFEGLVKQIPMDMTIPAFRRWEIRKKAAKDCAIFSINRWGIRIYLCINNPIHIKF